jgi:hypothetical protein
MCAPLQGIDFVYICLLAGGARQNRDTWSLLLLGKRLSNVVFDTILYSFDVRFHHCSLYF